MFTMWNQLIEIMDWESSDVGKFDLRPLQGQTRIAKLRSAYNLLIIDLRRACNILIIGPTGLQCETNL